MKRKQSITFRQLSKYLLQITRPFYPYLAFVVVLVVLEAIILASFLPKTIERLADMTNGSIQQPTGLQKLTGYLIWLVVLQASLEVNLRLQDYFFTVKIVPQLSRNIYAKHLNKLLEHSYQFYQHNLPGVISNNLTRLANTIPEIIDSLVLKITFFSITFVTATVSLYYILPLAGISLVIYFFFIGIVISVFNGRINLLTVLWTSNRAKVIARILDVITNIFTIKLFFGKRKERKAFQKMLTKTLHYEKGVEFTYLKMFAILGFGYLILQGISIYLLVAAISKGHISIGKLIAAIYINEMFVSLIWDDLPDLLQLSKQIGKAKQALTFEYIPTTVNEKPDAKKLVVKGGHIRFERIQFAFAVNEKPFFHDFTLNIPAGQKIGIVGNAGSGKSTLFKLLFHFFDIQKGSITIDGQNIAEVTQESLSQSIGFIPQDSSLLQRSLRENLEYGHEYLCDEDVVKAAKKAEVHAFIVGTEHGYESLVGEEGIVPSGGEKQRLSIARLLLKNPSIVLLDEATSQLDAITEKSINNTLKLFSKDKTTLVIAHRLSTLLQMDRIIVLNKGRIVEDGTHNTLLAKGGLYAHFWYTQSYGFIFTEKEPQNKDI